MTKNATAADWSVIVIAGCARAQQGRRPLITALSGIKGFREGVFRFGHFSHFMSLFCR
ncbi:hypothetical protein [Mycolicibacterium canariasense]|uniref:hypothetical protein n=1 Tax=Mycolicibacterium canariasense TaxID=228230 RepID=UPI0032D57D5E